LLDEAVTRAAALNADPAVARAIGVGAIKYADLSSDRLSDYTFDWDRMLALNGNTGPYLQYAYARIRSIFDKAGDVAPGPVLLQEATERTLAPELLGFEAVLRSVAESLEFHRLAGYLYGVAGAFSAFYQSCPVLKAPPGVRESRLSLCDRTAATLRQGLGLLGIETPERL
jgi:arginyl-tRNA synthetase